MLEINYYIYFNSMQFLAIYLIALSDKFRFEAIFNFLSCLALLK